MFHVYVSNAEYGLRPFFLDISLPLKIQRTVDRLGMWFRLNSSLAHEDNSESVKFSFNSFRL